MISLGLPWALALAPLPLLIWRLAPPHRERASALRFPGRWSHRTIPLR